ncbi:hypothetical protein [Thermomonas sp. HDW16]|uniref:hypothetical protein n=1 Tax=Thermomonas sp. HDW16 TaxID=2714945 RepID=UPI00140CF18B|nr:hypothetical protein [Thermomonas sp. HDW16]QIL21068.1 hypothetical protein G7079_10205 [Thermomonas sp. HDW16]
MDTDIATPKGIRFLAVPFGLLFVAGGLLALLTVTGAIPGEMPRTWYAQVFSITASVTFALAGIGFVFFGFGMKKTAVTIGALALLFFVIAFNWIAFGPGERNFTRTITFNGTVSRATAVSEFEGRAVFGGFALLLDLMVVGGLVKGIRSKT